MSEYFEKNGTYRVNSFGLVQFLVLGFELKFLAMELWNQMVDVVFSIEGSPSPCGFKGMVVLLQSGYNFWVRVDNLHLEAIEGYGGVHSWIWQKTLVKPR